MGGEWAVSGPDIGGRRATAGTQLPLELDRSGFAVNWVWSVLLSDDRLFSPNGYSGPCTSYFLHARWYTCRSCLVYLRLPLHSLLSMHPPCVAVIERATRCRLPVGGVN